MVETHMTRKGQLVTQYLENMSRELLEERQKIVREYVRKRHGIYALYRRGRLYYVGLASDLRSRLQAHLRDRHGESWDRFSVYLTISHTHMKDLECLALRIMHPPGNKESGKFRWSENLRRRLRRDIRKAQLAELDNLVGGGHRTVVKPRVDKAKQARKKGPTPKLAPYVERGFTIRTQYQGKAVRARVLKNGAISLRGKRYNSPSLAAVSVFGSAVNGWRVWLYQRAPGDWVPLRTLRR